MTEPACRICTGNVLGELEELLVRKNQSYGNSALNPLRIFSKASRSEQLWVRIDDKLSRLSCGTPYENEDTVSDLMGYLMLALVSEDLPEEFPPEAFVKAIRNQADKILFHKGTWYAPLPFGCGFVSDRVQYLNVRIDALIGDRTFSSSDNVMWLARELLWMLTLRAAYGRHVNGCDAIQEGLTAPDAEPPEYVDP